MRLIIFIDRNIPKNDIQKVVYVWELVAKLIGVSTEITNEMKENILSSDRFFAIYYGYLHNISKPIFNLIIPYEPLQTPIKVKYIQDLPILYYSKEPLYLVNEKKFGFDVIMIIFYLLVGYEEYRTHETDDLGRYMIKKTIFYRLKLYKIPLVNIYINLIKEEITKKFKNCFLPVWKANRPFALVLSHDVDAISTYSITNTIAFCKKTLNASSLLWKVKYAGYALISLLMTPSKYILKHDRLWAFAQLCELESRYDAKSTFFFLPLPLDSAHHLDRPYSYNERIFYKNKWMKLKDIITDMHHKGWGIGLHAGIETYDNPKLLKKQKESLQKLLNIKVKTVRQHLLRFRNDDTWKAQELAGFMCDSTFGFNEIIGFRSFFCHPYKPYSLSEDRTLNMWELPLTIQDNALLIHGGHSNDNYSKIAINLLEKVKKINGVAVLLWHTDKIEDKRYPEWLTVYEEILKWATSENAFIGSVEEIMNWWEYRDKQIIVNCDFYHTSI